MKNRIWDKILLTVLWIIGSLTAGICFFLFFYVFWRGREVVSANFILGEPSGIPLGTEGGIFPALAGSVLSGLLSALIAGTVGIGAAAAAAFYPEKKVVHLLKLSIFGLSGIPSILFGLVAYTLLIYRLGLPRSLLSASAAVAVMMIPFIAIRAEKILIEKGEQWMRQSLVLGLSREYALRKMILPSCLSELTGTTALAAAYGMGAVAPILYTGVVIQAKVPSSPLQPFMSLPHHLYILISNGYSEEYAYGSAFVLMLFLLLVHLLCRLLSFRSK